MNVTKALLDFIARSPSAYHTVQSVTDELKAAGYAELIEGQSWKLQAGGRYFVTRNLSSVIAFALPDGTPPCGYMIAAAHSDSPTFKLKENIDTDAAGYTRINVEKYGGMLCSTWFDRPLSAAGKVTVSEGDRIVSHLVDLDDDLFLIPSVAIHMNRSANEGASYNAATDMQPITGTAAVKGGLKKRIAEVVNAPEDAVIAYDLFLYPRIAGSVWGLDKEFISAPRLDDLQCVYGLLRGFLSAKTDRSMPVLFIADNEEVGSSTKQGAASTFLADVRQRVNEALGGTASDYRRAVAQSFMVSADNAHAV
ncbi:MAG: M18 family aminopeptidase, partial [Clostridia bacterium]|nr:M18 family aminopeptidase [Clostridia bacterium]